MLKTHKIQLRMSELREKINGITDDSAESSTKRETLIGELNGLETEYRTALTSDGTSSTVPKSDEWSNPVRAGSTCGASCSA